MAVVQSAFLSTRKEGVRYKVEEGEAYHIQIHPKNLSKTQGYAILFLHWGKRRKRCPPGGLYPGSPFMLRKLDNLRFRRWQGLEFWFRYPNNCGKGAAIYRPSVPGAAPQVAEGLP